MRLGADQLLQFEAKYRPTELVGDGAFPARLVVCRSCDRLVAAAVEDRRGMQLITA
jgi:hypothetical protein